MEKLLAKITHCSFGFGGYDEAMVGASFTFQGQGCGVSDFWGTWSMEPSQHAEWTQQSRLEVLGTIVMRLSKVLSDAKAKDVAGLIGKPVEVTLKDGRLESWRILTEVI